MARAWKAAYMDGRSARSLAASVTVMPEGLRVAVSGLAPRHWRYEEVRQTQGENAGEHVRLERGDEIAPEVLEISEPGFLEAVREVAPQARLVAPPARGRYVAWVAGCALATVGLVAVSYTWGIPALAEVAARRVPVAWEERLGDAVSNQLAKPDERDDNPRKLAAVEDLVGRLTAGRKGSGYRYRVAIAKTNDVNAFAAPGGYIVVFDGLLRKTRTPEELAGVLAHEIQHVEHKHTTKGLLRQASMQLVVSALTGDTGQMSQTIGFVGTLGTLGYQRKDEDEADREGMQMMIRARLDPQGMVRMFETLQQELGDDGELARKLGFLSSHPNTEDRLKVLRTMAKRERYQPVEVMPAARWRKLVQAE